MQTCKQQPLPEHMDKCIIHPDTPDLQCDYCKALINHNEIFQVEKKLCINCEHVAKSHFGNWKDFKCFAPQNKLYDNLVDGKPVYKDESCEHHRRNEQEGITTFCGPEGKWFVQRTTQSKVNFEPTMSYGEEKLPDYDPAKTPDLNAILAKRRAEKAAKGKLSEADLKTL